MYKMVCSKICFLFIVFGMVQIQLRWKRDDVIRFKPWRVAFKGHTTDVHQKTVAPIEFQKKKISYGECPIYVHDNKIQSHERIEVEMIIDMELHGPPLSFHRINPIGSPILFSIDLFVPYSGVAHAQRVHRMVLIPSYPISFNHAFDSVWNVIDRSNLTLTVALRNGLPNLYDAPWKTL